MSVHDPRNLGQSRGEGIILFAERPCGAHGQYCLTQKNHEEHVIDILRFFFFFLIGDSSFVQANASSRVELQKNI